MHFLSHQCCNVTGHKRSGPQLVPRDPHPSLGLAIDQIIHGHSNTNLLICTHTNTSNSNTLQCYSVHSAVTVTIQTGNRALQQKNHCAITLTTITLCTLMLTPAITIDHLILIHICPATQTVMDWIMSLSFASQAASFRYVGCKSKANGHQLFICNHRCEHCNAHQWV